MCGYVKMYRSLTEHWLADQPAKLGWWLLLILKASHKDIQVSTGSQIINLKRGQIVASLSFLAALWKTSKTTADRFLDMLVKNGMVQRCTEHKLTIITICNYDRYQGEENGKRNDSSDDSSDDDGTMMGTKQECKECKEDNIYSSNQYAREEILGWDAERENRYAATFKGQGTAIPLSKKIGKTPREVMNLLEIYMAHREVKNRGHKDYNEFLNLFMWHIENKKITIPEAAPKAQTQPKVITGQDIFSIYK